MRLCPFRRPRHQLHLIADHVWVFLTRSYYVFTRHSQSQAKENSTSESIKGGTEVLHLQLSWSSHITMSKSTPSAQITTGGRGEPNCLPRNVLLPSRLFSSLPADTKTQNRAGPTSNRTPQQGLRNVMEKAAGDERGLIPGRGSGLADEGAVPEAAGGEGVTGPLDRMPSFPAPFSTARNAR